MSDTANVARGAYQRFFRGSQATAESRVRDTASVRDLYGEPLRRSLVGGLGEWHESEGTVGSDEFSADLERQTQLPRSAKLPHEATLWAMRVGRPVSEHHPSVPHWCTKGDLGTAERGYLANTGPYSSASMVQHAVQDSSAGMAELPPHDDRDLLEALSDLDSLSEEAKEDDLPEPDAEAVANARILLPHLYAILPVRYRVSPTERRGVAIDAPMKWGASVAVECAPDDTVYCFATIDGNSRRAKFYQMDGLPDVFIEKALRDLAAG